MKIAHVLINYHPSIGGTQLLFKGISENLVSIYKDEVEVLTIDSYFGSHSKHYKPITPLIESLNGVTIKRFPFYKSHKTIFSLILKIWIKLTGKILSGLQIRITGPWSPALTKTMNETSADVIAASSSGYMFMQYPLYRNQLKNPKPFVIQGAIHFSVLENHQAISNTTLQSIHAAEYYIANTQYEKDRLIGLGVEAEKIEVVGVATDVHLFEKGNPSFFRRKLNLSNEDIVIGYFGRIESTKNINILVESFILAKKENKNLKLVIAGLENKYYKTLHAYIQEQVSVFKNDILFVLNPTDTEKVNLYHLFDMLVLPSTNESFGIVFLEAWACKKPVIGAAIGAVKSVINENIDGLLMQPNDTQSLKEKILQLASNSNLRHLLGENGYQKTITQYTWEAVTKKYRDIYQLAINKFNNVQRRSHLG